MKKGDEGKKEKTTPYNNNNYKAIEPTTTYQQAPSAVGEVV